MGKQCNKLKGVTIHTNAFRQQILILNITLIFKIYRVSCSINGLSKPASVTPQCSSKKAFKICWCVVVHKGLLPLFTVCSITHTDCRVCHAAHLGGSVKTQDSAVEIHLREITPLVSVLKVKEQPPAL